MSGTLDFEFDVFISHASEDKDDFARPLAEALDTAGFKVWFDEWALTMGDRLRRKIDEGLRLSRFGVVLLSPAFFSKDWPQRELDGLSALEGDGNDRILPVWHRVGRADVSKFSATLADRLAADSAEGVKAVCDQISEAIRKTPRYVPTPAPQRRAERAGLVNLVLQTRNLADIGTQEFGLNEDIARIDARPRVNEAANRSKVVFSLVPLGESEDLVGEDLFDWAASSQWAEAHPLAHTDQRPRGDGIFLTYQRYDDGSPTRYTFIAENGYVEWGRALGGSNGDVAVVRLGPLLAGASQLYQFAGEFKDRFELRCAYEMVVSIVQCRDTCLSHLGKGWLEPWERNYQYYRPKAMDRNVQYRWPMAAPAGAEDERQLILKLDTYLNRVWGDDNPRGHDHPRENSGKLVFSDQYANRDPWE